MEYLDSFAALDYKNLTTMCFRFGCIGWSIFIDRIVALKDMTREIDKVHSFASRIIAAEDLNEIPKWEDDETAGRDASSESEDNEKKYGIYRDDADGCICYRSSIQGLANWIFHQYDDDYFPSIPHGHFKSCNHKKLDAYLGWKYDRTHQIGREPRNLIIKLWNDNNFREFAKVAIGYYTETYPNYKWRVVNPFRLPRKF